MTDRKISPGLKYALEYGPILLFFAGFLLLKDRSFFLFGAERTGFVVMTVVFVPLLIATTLLQWRLSGEISRMQILTLILVIVFGGLTIWLNDPKFLKMKPTILYVFFAGALGIGLLQGKSYLEYVLGQALPMKPEGWMILTKRVALFFLALAILNEIIWRTQSETFWVSFKTFGLTAGVFLFFMTQAKLIDTYMEKPDETAPGNDK